jgi:hypothetical protein
MTYDSNRVTTIDQDERRAALEARLAKAQGRSEKKQLIMPVLRVLYTFKKNPELCDVFTAYHVQHHASPMGIGEKKEKFLELLMDHPVRDPTVQGNARGISIKDKEAIARMFEDTSVFQAHTGVWNSYVSLCDPMGTTAPGSYSEVLRLYDLSKVDPRHNAGRVQKNFPDFHKATSIDSLYPPVADFRHKV